MPVGTKTWFDCVEQNLSVSLKVSKLQKNGGGKSRFKRGIHLCAVLSPASAVTLMIYMLSPHSESPYSEHGALEEVENEGGTETHTSEDGEF